MAESAVETRPHTVKITDAGPSRKKLEITIPSELVDEKLRDSLDTLALEAELPGFRKGRVPKALVEKRFGGLVKTEAKNQLVASAVSQAVEDHKLKVIGEPFSNTLKDLELAEGKDLAFEVEVEVMPEFELPSLDGIDVKKPLLEVTDTMTEEELNKILINEGQLESRDTPEPGDYLTGHGIMKGADGHEFYNIEGCVVQMPTADKNGVGMILGVKVDDFTKQFGKPKVNDTVSIKTKGPENHEEEKLRGADLTVTFKVMRIDRIIPAQLDDVVKGLGFENPQGVKDALKSRLQQRVNVQQQVAMRQQVANHLLKNTKVDLPQRMTAVQAMRTLERRRMELMYRGVEAAKIEEHIAELRAASGNEAVRDLKLFFVLNKAAEDLKISVDDAEINGRIAQLAIERNMRPEKLRQELIQRNQVGTIYQQIREHKTMDRILSKAKVTEMSADDFNKQMKDAADVVKA